MLETYQATVGKERLTGPIDVVDGALEVDLDDGAGIQLREGRQAPELPVGVFQFLGLLPAIDGEREMGRERGGHLDILAAETDVLSGGEGEGAQNPPVGIERDRQDRVQGIVP